MNNKIKKSTIIISQNAARWIIIGISYIHLSIKAALSIGRNALPFPRKKTAQQPDPLVDLAYSKEAFSNVGMLTGTVKLPCGIIHTIFGASAVYLGGVNVLTNIHCIEPWLSIEGNTPKGRLYTTIALNFNVVGKNGEILKSYPLELSAKVHPMHAKSSCHSKLKYDVAILKLKNEIESLSGMAPCFEDIDKDDLKGAYTCGFGSSGRVSNLLSAIDGKKRATYIPLLMTRLPKLGSKKMFAGNYSAYLGKRIRTTQDEVKFEDCVVIPETFTISENNTIDSREGGMRMGMSGGMLLDAKNRFIGIPTMSMVDLYQKALTPSLKSFYRSSCRTLRKRISCHIMKYVSALTYLPVPFLTPETGDLNIFTKFSESDIKDWLRENLD